MTPVKALFVRAFTEPLVVKFSIVAPVAELKIPALIPIYTVFSPTVNFSLPRFWEAPTAMSLLLSSRSELTTISELSIVRLT